MWLDSIPYTASVESNGIPTLEKIKFKDKKVDEIGYFPYSVDNGFIATDGKIITGNQYNITWWNGRVKDNFTRHGAKPVITRFVPGRTGTGWTDNIKEVVDFLDKNHFNMLYHHYGLWYDLRRTDHERVRRSDGEVSPPFYEQPFARSGQGTAFDGLSKYDLNKPNEWFWGRLNEFAQEANPKGILLFNNHYFQHNILEAGAHWVDCPWRPVNNINGTTLPEPVNFTGDKRIFIADQFYDVVNSEVMRKYHRQYIRMCLDKLKDQPNVVHLISAEYTGPKHFTRFWLETIAEWEKETGKHPLIAISCTKDAQDELLADPVLGKVIDIIDIRYWHYNKKGLWAPEAGKNLAPRQWMRKFPVGSTGPEEAYKAVREYRDKYPEKAVTFYSQQYPSYGWAILMAGGSLANVRIENLQLKKDILAMRPMDGKGCHLLGNADKGYLIEKKNDSASVQINPGKYNLYKVDKKSGEVKLTAKSIKVTGSYQLPSGKSDTVLWLEKK